MAATADLCVQNCCGQLLCLCSTSQLAKNFKDSFSAIRQYDPPPPPQLTPRWTGSTVVKQVKFPTSINVPENEDSPGGKKGHLMTFLYYFQSSPILRWFRYVMIMPDGVLRCAYGGSCPVPTTPAPNDSLVQSISPAIVHR